MFRHLLRPTTNTGTLPLAAEPPQLRMTTRRLPSGAQLSLCPQKTWAPAEQRCHLHRDSRRTVHRAALAAPLPGAEPTCSLAQRCLLSTTLTLSAPMKIHGREGLADAGDDAVDLVPGCCGDAEHVEAAVNEPGP